MASLIFQLLTFLGLFLLEIFYFKVANIYNIIDKPNFRSSHNVVTIRGGGIIFPISAILFFCISGFQYPWFIAGLILLTLVSFIDDLVMLSNITRIIIHIISVFLLLVQLQLFDMPIYVIFAAAFFIIGTMNAYNFMDGINGLTGLYSFITIGTLFYINHNVVDFISDGLLINIAMALVVFNIFNFRKKAKCFAGDVGSMCIAFIILFVLLQLIIKTHDYNYLLFLLIYGLDAVITILLRLVRKENIFEAHRTHFYQFLANEKKLSHLFVSIIYAVIQLLVNCILILKLSNSFWFGTIVIISSSLIFLLLRFIVEGPKRLLGE